MAVIQVLQGLRYTPEMFLKKMEKSKRLQKQQVECRHVNTIYGLCWVFQFRVKLQASKKTVRYAGYYAGFDETVMTPGKLAMLPTYKECEVEDHLVLADRLTEAEALAKSWEYNKNGIFRKFRSMYAPPELEDHVTERCYKPLFVMEFYNREQDEKKYRVLDSLTGDLDEIMLEE